MRHSYTPVFKDVLTSRVWALPDAQLRVWLWLTLNADPEGFVCADLAGVAVAARVSAQDAREALDVLALPDADADPADPFEGRIIERVRRGWRVLVAEDNRELAKSEAKKARQRRYMKAARVADGAAANDTTHAELTSEPAELPVDATKPIPKPKTKPSSEDGGDLPLPPPSLQQVSPLREAQGTPTVWRTLEGWTMSPELRSEALMAGVPADFIEDYLRRLRNGPIGGTRGVLDRDDYVRSMFGKWRTWSEVERAKAPKGTPAPVVTGFPRWVRKEHVEYLAGDRGTLKVFAQRFAQEHHIPPRCLHANEAATAFGLFLKAAIRNGAQAQASTPVEAA